LSNRNRPRGLAPLVTTALAACILLALTACSPSSGTTAGSGSSPAAGAGTGSGTVTSCPTAAAVSTAASSTYTGPQTTTGSATVCTYNNTSSNVGLTITFGPAPAAASAFKLVIQSESDGATINSISGFGPNAYTFTKDDGAKAPNFNDTTIGFLNGKDEYLIVGAVSPANLQAVAKLML
jgi:hypothetical protein